MNMQIKTGLIIVIAIWLLSFSLLAQKPEENPIAPKTPNEPKAEATKSEPHEMTEADVEAFLDGLVPMQIERNDIAGAVISVVKDGKMLFAKGYGYADVKKKIHVSADNTLFRPGSISKLFTWTAVMQLVEQGKIDLDRDVNTYLDFKIPDAFSKPITLRNIMTHTPGFGETAKDLFVADVKDMTPLRVYLVNHIPNRIFPPGTIPAYSNYATTVAGYVVQRVSGKPFNDYIRQNIFDPLAMQHTTFEQPLPAGLLPMMSNGYHKASGDAGKFEVVQAWPAGSVATSAADMTHFMIAHLQNGEYNGARILQTKTAELMHSRQFAPHPALPGMALGFYEETRNGHRIIGHGGDTYFFHSDMHLVLDAGIGFFVSYNSAGKGEESARTELWQKFLDRYLPYKIPNETTPPTAAQDAKLVSGLYVASRRAEGNILDATGFMGEIKVSANSDGTISADAFKDPSGQLKKFREIGPLLFRELNGQDRIGFQRDASGRLFFAMDYPFFIFQKAGLLQDKRFNYIVLGFSASVLILALLLWPVAALIRRHYGYKLALTPQEKRLRLIVRLICLLDLIFLGAMTAVLSTLEEPGAINSHLDMRIHLLQILGILGALGTIVAIYHAIKAWSSPAVLSPSVATAGLSRCPGASVVPAREERSIWLKLVPTLIALACIGLTWFLIYWNVLNLNLNY